MALFEHQNGHVCMSASSAQYTTKLRRLLPYETSAVDKLSDRCCEAKLNFVNLYVCWVHAYRIHPVVFMFNIESLVFVLTDV